AAACVAAWMLSTCTCWNGRMSGLLHRRLALVDRGDDVRVGRAAADVATHIFADVGSVRGMAFVDAGHRRHVLARRTVAALEGVVVDERLLHRVERAVGFGQSFDRRDAAALRGGGERETREYPAAVDQHRARSALAVIAAFLRTGQPGMLAQR